MSGLRLTCCVPHCNRTRGDRKGNPVREGDEWICEVHWPLVSKTIKRRRAKLRRMLKRSVMQRRTRILDIDDRLWAICKKKAIERAMGI